MPSTSRWGLPSWCPGGHLHAVWGPTFLVDSQCGRVWLFYSESTGACKGRGFEWAPGGDVKAVRYNLHTQQWSQPQLLLSLQADDGIPKVTANKAIQLSNGDFVLPFWRERALLATDGRACKQLTGKQSAGVLISEDRGGSWKAYGQLTSKGTWLIENTLAELPGGRLIMAFRSQAGRIIASFSDDRGRSWSAATPLADFKNPNAKTDLLRLEPNGELALVYNDHIIPTKDPELQRQGCTKCRTHLRVAISHDSGATWHPLANLGDDIGHSLRLHYPTLQQVGCKLVVIWSRYYTKRMAWHDPSFVHQGIQMVTLNLQASPLRPWGLIKAQGAGQIRSPVWLPKHSREHAPCEPPPPPPPLPRHLQLQRHCSHVANSFVTATTETRKERKESPPLAKPGEV
eukprot:CAMPEP_0117667216 /NCGR_PEP_ID=MMETSP0804-20121206/10833_1 /TAXON_ID=1074897 /ORGANISM="Tetraselmis astigmatica, Strain CCMP880" /LENGTH=400 /DNA_ID=CAMNT_0005474897 /DNA_START=283 /DNA_END=1483 /DNA_ORIENTATION=+